jgi:hypothetical protein
VGCRASLEVMESTEAEIVGHLACTLITIMCAVMASVAIDILCSVCVCVCPRVFACACWGGFNFCSVSWLEKCFNLKLYRNMRYVACPAHFFTVC